MKIEIERNTGENSEIVPYIAHVDTSDLTIHSTSAYDVPVEIRQTGPKKEYHVNICGFDVKADNPDHLPTKIEWLISHLVNVARFPKHVFIARRAKTVYPVYTIGNEVMATTPGGPIFQHVELAKVREFLTDYLHQTSVLGDSGVSDRLHVRGTNMHTLGLRRPVMYLKKRVVGEDEFWAPVFENGAGDGIYTYAVNARRDVAISDGSEILQLRDVVANALKNDGRLNDLNDLRADRLMPAYWERLKETLTPAGTLAVNDHTLEVYTKGSTWVAVESRPDEERYGLYVGGSESGLEGRVKRDFIRRGR